MGTLHKFILKTAAFALPPLLLVGLIYFIKDPFKVLRDYNDYFANGLSVNKGVVTARTFETLQPEYQFDSFIIGSSLSCYYQLDDWKLFIGDDARPFHFDSSGQPIETTRLSLEYLIKNTERIRNVLIILDPFIFHVRPGTDMVGIDPVQIHSEWWYGLYFHYKMFRNFMNIKYLVSYVPWTATGRPVNYSDALIFEPQPIVWNRVQNEETIPQWEDSIKYHRDRFYENHQIEIFDTEFFTDPNDYISPEIERELREIAALLEKEGCDYKIIIGPNLRHEILSAEDDSIMRDIFAGHYFNCGKDFRELTMSPDHFYDNRHYRHTLARQILSKVYQQ